MKRHMFLQEPLVTEAVTNQPEPREGREDNDVKPSLAELLGQEGDRGDFMVKIEVEILEDNDKGVLLKQIENMGKKINNMRKEIDKMKEDAKKREEVLVQVTKDAEDGNMEKGKMKRESQSKDEEIKKIMQDVVEVKKDLEDSKLEKDNMKHELHSREEEIEKLVQEVRKKKAEATEQESDVEVMDVGNDDIEACSDKEKVRNPCVYSRPGDRVWLS